MSCLRLICLVLLVLCPALSQEPDLKGWEAVCTTDTDIVFSIKLPKDDYTWAEKAEFPLRVWHPDGRVDDYEVTLWRGGKGQYKRSGSLAEAPEPKMIDPESPMGRVHLRVFSPEEFRKWDDSLEDLGPRHEELYKKPEE